MIDIDQGVVEGLRRGEHQAYKVVVEVMFSPVHAFLVCLCRNADAAADLTQETFLAVWEGIDSFQGKSRFRTWIFGIAYHQFLRYRDKHREMATLEDCQLEGSTEPQTVIEEAEMRSQVHGAVNALPEIYREVVCLVHLDGFTYRETADILGLSIGTVKSRMNAAFRMLREILGGVMDNESTVREPEDLPGRRTRCL